MNKMNRPLGAQQGFTLIELIMVIVILGILSAVALPKFADFTDNAKSASISGALGGVKAGVAIAHAQWLASGGTPSASITLEGSTITMNAGGYPTADAAGLGELIDLSSYTENYLPTTPPAIISLGDGLAGDICFSYTVTTGSPTFGDIGTVPVSGTTLLLATCT
jgi:MSHA pilin protein MshA